jgi:hypothetical protein
MSALCH